MRRAQSDATPGPSQTSSLPPRPSSANREGRPGRSGFWTDGAGPPFGADSALARLHSCLTRGAALGEWQRLEPPEPDRSEEHTSELQSQSNLVCRLLLEKKK